MKKLIAALVITMVITACNSRDDSARKQPTSDTTIKK